MSYRIVLVAITAVLQPVVVAVIEPEIISDGADTTIAAPRTAVVTAPVPAFVPITPIAVHAAATPVAIAVTVLIITALPAAHGVRRLAKASCVHADNGGVVPIEFLFVVGRHRAGGS